MADGKKIIIGIVIGGVLVCGLGGLGAYNGFGQPERQYRSEIEKGVAAGLPEKPDAYQKTVVPDKNAASVYTEAITVWTKFQQDNRETANRVSARLQPADYFQKDAKADFIAVQPLIKLLDQAASYPSLCFDKPYSHGFQNDFPEYGPLRTFVRIRCMQAVYLARQSRFDSAYAELGRAAAIPRHLGTDNPSILGLLVSISLRNNVTRTLERILCLQGRNPRASDQATQIFAALGPLPSLQTSLRGEYAGLLGSLDLLQKPDRLAQLSQASRSDSEMNQNANRTLARLMAWPAGRYLLMSNAVRASRTAYTDVVNIPTNDIDLINANLGSEKSDAKRSSPDNTLVQMLVPASGQVSRSLVREVAEERLVRVLAASLSQARGVRIPSELAIDPFTKKPLLVKETPTSFRIWSVGVDLKDDGGKVSFSNSLLPNGGADIVVGYPFVEKTSFQRRSIGPGIAAAAA